MEEMREIYESEPYSTRLLLLEKMDRDVDLGSLLIPLLSLILSSSMFHSNLLL